MSREQLLVAALAAISAMTTLTACASDDDGQRSNAAQPTHPSPNGSGVTSTPAPPPPPPPAPPPFGAEVGKWKWIDVPESMCGNGEPTGMALNPGTGTDLVVFLTGGGGCWDELTCALGTATYVQTGFGAKDFDEFLAAVKPLPDILFNREAPDNPFKNSSFVFVPYCTGDVFAGDAEQQWLFPPRTMHYAGRKNIEAYLRLLAPAYAHASRVVLTGSSAGGFGSALNFWRFQDAFGEVRVDLIDDSGPPFEQKDMPLLPAWKNAWKLDGAFPPDCDECKSNITTMTAYYARKYPSSRFAMLSYDQDNVISTFFLSSKEAFATNLRAMVKNRIEPLPNMRYFIVPGTKHTMLFELATKSGEVRLDGWIGQMLGDAPGWANVDDP